MQKLQLKLKNVPRDVQSLLVPCSTSLQLNRVQRLSVADKVLDCNNPEGVQVQHTGRSLKPLVYVLSKKGKPLMPCSYSKSKRMVKSGKATVVKRFPFVIQLCFECEDKIQKVTLGIDSGFGNIGFSAVSEFKELISGTVKLDGKTSDRLIERRMYRRNRRNRLWYRKPRFLNRSKPKGWLPPSVQRRYDTHLNIINRLKKILPISEVVIEVANFDIQKIMNPEISGTDYQQGSLYGYQNMRSFLMAREHGRCQLCGKDFKNQPSHIHHCKQRSEVGSSRAENLAILHQKCHIKLHKQGLKLSKPKSYKPNTFMSIIHKRFWKDVDNLQVTYGYKTFIKRNELNLEKSHSTDAFVIANGDIQERIRSWNIEQKHRHNRAIQLNRKGFKPSIRTSVYKIQPKDLIWGSGKMFSVAGVQNKGSYVKVKDFKKVIPLKAIDFIYNFGGFAWLTEAGFIH